MAVQSSILNYRIERILGKGGMGTVYLGRHNQIDRKVAIKELKPAFANDPSIRERFKNEAALMANLSHPNIVGLHDYIETPAGVYLVMEYVEGMPVDYYLHEVSGPIPENKVVGFFAKILDAVHYAHQLGVIHRDLKPANIMITRQGDIKILDFGIAKNISSEDSNLTQTGVRMGTIYYMSPEQIRAREVDIRSDIYSLGVTLFEMLTAQNPYHQENLSEYDISLKIVSEPLPPAKDFYPGVSDPMQKILEKATAKDPNDRFPNAKAFKDALLAHQAALPDPIPHSENTVEWIIRPKDNGETKPDHLDHTPIPTLPKREFLILDNSFGAITNKKIRYFRGRDLFEKGASDEISLNKIMAAELTTHRETSTGVFFLIVAILLLLFYLRIFTLILASLLSSFLACYCFLKFPTILIVRSDLKKIKMRGWPWDIRQASHFVLALKEQMQA
ncbi:MAG: serine/threonine protein kinase [Bacteroidia bacterium]|nr:serine/threonine protein kinase [Bacteroidia bacterium]